MATGPADTGERFVLENIEWDDYEAILAALGDQPGIRVTYDGESLEFRRPSLRHEFTKCRAGRLIDTLTLELDIPILGGGSTTFRRKIIKKGLEPDECYWIQNEEAVRVSEDEDWDRDPVPDLAIEVEVTTSVLNRRGIYAALGVPEIWRLVNSAVQVNLLQSDGTYAVSETSRAFPFLPMAEFSQWLEIPEGKSETSWIRSFAEWVRGRGFRV